MIISASMMIPNTCNHPTGLSVAGHHCASPIFAARPSQVKIKPDESISLSSSSSVSLYLSLFLSLYISLSLYLSAIGHLRLPDSCLHIMPSKKGASPPPCNRLSWFAFHPLPSTSSKVIFWLTPLTPPRRQLSSFIRPPLTRLIWFNDKLFEGHFCPFHTYKNMSCHRLPHHDQYCTKIPLFYTFSERQHSDKKKRTF